MSRAYAVGSDYGAEKEIAAAARGQVLEALDVIIRQDTDPQFVQAARARYLDITNTPLRADGGANITTTHINIRAGK